MYLFSWLFSRYKLSAYNTIVPQGDFYLLHNQISGAMLKLSAKAHAAYQTYLKSNRLSYKYWKLFATQGILIPKTTDELQLIADVWGKTVKENESKSMTIVTTDRCNLGCSYCYQSKADWHNMHTETQEQLKKFISAYLRGSKTKSFGVVWFGGEPTLNAGCIENVGKFIVAECKELGIPLSQLAVTNGTTMVPKMAQRLRESGLTRLQITVDGMKDYHDQLRPYLASLTEEQMNPAQKVQRVKATGIELPVLGQPTTKSSSFDDIVQGITVALEAGFQISLRINVNAVNQESVVAFYHFMNDKGWFKKHANGARLTAYTHPVFSGCGDCPTMAKSAHAEFVKTLPQLGANPGRTGIRTLSITGGTCTANKDYQFVINSSGAIIKCWHHATDDSHALGTIDDLSLATKGTAEVDRYRFNPLLDAECRTCHVLPTCLGGCKQNNKFDTAGYAGTKDSGCSTLRWNLPDEIRQAYETMTQA